MTKHSLPHRQIILLHGLKPSFLYRPIITNPGLYTNPNSTLIPQIFHSLFSFTKIPFNNSFFHITDSKSNSPIMRFKKGSKVEVLTKKEFPTGAWRCAEIISGDGQTYSVKYSWFPFTGEAAAVERVPRKSIRPCPPPMNGSDDWVSGDVVELFDELCWKLAVIVRVFGGNNFSVRILGSNSEHKAHQSRLRVRQFWEDGNWFLVGKGSSNSTGPPKRKRSSLGFSDVGGQKKRAIRKGSITGKRILLRLPSPASEKVDAFVSPKNILGERCMPSPFHRIDDTMSFASSIGSCSGLGNNGLDLSPSYVTNGCENLEDYCSDADSYSERRCGEEGSSVSSSVELGTDFHRLELHAYQQALGALHASGPLTWEEEEQNISWSMLEASIPCF
ncbi:hypothetical protein CRYUN_Cryun34aG0085800 [Craigia yunnanensis]